MEKTVSFAFWPGDKLTTPLGEQGIVTMVGIDDTLTNQYYVEAIGHSTWWTGAQLLNCNTDEVIKPKEETSTASA